MLKALTDFGSEVTLVANSSLQFLDFGFSLGTAKGASQNFAEMPDGENSDLSRLRQLVLDEETDAFLDSQSREVITSDAIYNVNFKTALQIFNDVWLPLPFFRSQVEAQNDGPDRFEDGPTIWTRLRVVQLETPDEQGNEYRATIAFDTRFEDRRDDQPYTLATPEDIINESQFELASKLEEFSWFLDEHWVKGWLKELLKDAQDAGNAPKFLCEDDSEPHFPHWACYIVFLEELARVIRVPTMRFVDTISPSRPHVPFEVDLILDIGNNRTCGVLVESNSQAQLDLKSARSLEIRDLERVEMAYKKPFQSRVEFRELKFGKGTWPAMAGTRNSFMWPSFLRLGDEALRLNAMSVGSEGVSGLSAPKRYLWDETPREQQWSFNVGGKPPGTRSAIVGPLMGHLTDSGELVSKSENVSPAFQAKFSRSSIFSLQVMEILMHAIRQINEPAHREALDDRDVPRRLRRIVLTVPSATPVVEQRYFEKRAQNGLDLVWETMGWDKPENRQFEKPELKVAYDEASCTQLVFLYSEIMKRYQRSAENFLRLKAPAGIGANEAPQLRIASIDIGGGTTDLMISTFSAQASQPHQMKITQNFREGFRLAGDDIVKQVISEHVLTGLAQNLRQCGLQDATGFLTEMLNDANVDAKDRQRRLLFVTQVLTPIAYALLSTYEKASSPISDGVSFQNVFDAETKPPQELLDYFELQAQDSGAANFKLEDVRFPMDAKKMDRTIDGVIGANLRNLASVVANFGCDYLLMTGRPSQLPIVRDIVLTTMPVAPHRVISMHDYTIGDWYPFAGKGNVIGDPKTTVVVGALICSLAEGGNLTNFGIPINSFSLPSTANIVGLLEIGGAMLEDHILFRRQEDSSFQEESNEFVFGGPILLGFRQLDNANWPATPLYRLSVPSNELDDKLKRSFPWTVKLIKPPLTESAIRRDEQEDESFKVGDVSLEDGEDFPRGRGKLKLHLQTILDADGFWTDTGKIDVPPSL
ncbi:MAG: virulence factor SrfB [Hyphomicrobiales bacterium]